MNTLLTVIVISILSFKAVALNYPNVRLENLSFARSDSSFKFKELDMGKFHGDTLPSRAMAAIKDFHQNEIIRLNRYIRMCNPSKEYILQAQLNLSYLPIERFYSFMGVNKLRIMNPYQRNLKAWRSLQDSLFSDIILSNDKALTCSYYTDFISTFLLREKERLWNESVKDPVSFYKQWYNSTPEEGTSLFQADPNNLLNEKIIKHYFKNQTAEYLYAVLFNQIINERDPTNALAIYDRFKQSYPDSKYIGPFAVQMANIAERQKSKKNSKITFAENNGSLINSFSELLAQVKGKVVLLDMWGTWCGPCRVEFEKSTPFIKRHFYGKDVNYLYVANFDLKNEEKWKELVAFFNLEGLHVLANDSLNQDIMASVKRNSYPTYVIIKKDGTYELSNTGFPVRKEVIIKQLESALSEDY